jgi:hypothetical protein
VPYAQRVNGQPACRRYDLFTGSPTSPEQVANSQHYQTGSNIPTRKYGWSAYMCSGHYPAVCQVPAEAFPCGPPPLESPQPPLPPSPPSPPFPPNCELRNACSTACGTISVPVSASECTSSQQQDASMSQCLTMCYLQPHNAVCPGKCKPVVAAEAPTTHAWPWTGLDPLPASLHTHPPTNCTCIHPALAPLTGTPWAAAHHRCAAVQPHAALQRRHLLCVPPCHGHL